MKLPLLLSAALAFAASPVWGAQPYHAIYDISGSMVKEGSTQEVYFLSYWERMEVNDIRMGVGPFATRDFKTTWYIDGMVYVAEKKKNGDYKRRGTVTENVMAEPLRDASDSELEAFGAKMYADLGYKRDGRDSAKDCDKWTHGQLGQICLRDDYLMVYMDGPGMSYMLREVFHNFDADMLDLPGDVNFREVNLDFSNGLAGLTGNQNNTNNAHNRDVDTSDVDMDADEAPNNGVPNNAREALGMLKGLFGGRNKDQEPEDKDTQQSSSSSSSSAEGATQGASSQADEGS